MFVSLLGIDETYVPLDFDLENKNWNFIEELLTFVFLEGAWTSRF